MAKRKVSTRQGSVLVRRGPKPMVVKRKTISNATKKSWVTRKKKYGLRGRVKRKKR